MSKSRRSRSESVKSVKQCNSGKAPATSYRQGRVTRNPFLNFLRDFRKSNTGLKITELTKRGAELWRKMNDRQKSPYYQLARQAPRRKRRRRRSKRRGGRRRRRNRGNADEENRYSNNERKCRRDDNSRCRKKDSSDCVQS